MSNETNSVKKFGLDDPTAIARSTGVLRESQPLPTRPRFDNNNNLKDSDEASSGDQARSTRLLKVGATVAGIAALAGFLSPKVGDSAPEPTPLSYEEQAQQSAQQPYHPATDHLLIDGIRVKPGGTASETVMNDPQVKQFLKDNPDERDPLITSAESLPSGKSYVVVNRDINNDGSPDAIAAPAR